MKPVIIIAIAFVLLIPISVFAQSSEKSLSNTMTITASYLLTAFTLLIIPILIVLGILKHKGILNGFQLKIYFAGIGIFFLVFLGVLFSAPLFLNDEEKLVAENRRESIEFSERTQAEMEKRMAQMEREKAEFESATVPSGSLGFEKLKYRPYWLVDDEWDEKERTGKIVKSQDCVGAVTVINDNLGDIQKTFYKAWLIDCVK